MKTSAGLWALIFKAGPKLGSVLLKLAKGLKFGKAGLATVSFASYAYMFTWEFAALIMVTLFVHECGHVWAMKRCGLKTKGIYFIPFVGGAAVQEEACHNRGEDVYISLMGPVWGFLLTVAVAALYYVYQKPMFAAAAAWMAMVNLFNLFPVIPLDGGRVLKSVTFSIRSWLGFVFLILGLTASGYIVLKTGMFLFVFLLGIGMLDLIIEYSKKTTIKKNEFGPDDLPWYKKITITEDETLLTQIPKMDGSGVFISLGCYLALVGALFIVMDYMKHVPGAALALEFMKS
jgi:Zn-dependent protease